MRILLGIFITFLLLTTTGCGGGGGGGGEASTPASSTTSTSSSSPTQTTTTPSTSTPTLKDGIKITDSSAVEGMKVLCDGLEITTDENGEFHCSSLPFSLYLGEYKLGEISKLPSDKIIYIQDIIHVPRGAIAHSEVTKVSMILQTLDDDANPLNGITLKSDSIEILNIQLTQDSKLQDLSLEDVETILKDVIFTRKNENANSRLQLFTAQEAQENLANKIAQTPAQTYEQRSMGRIQ